MQVQFTPDELNRIATFITDLNVFVDKNADVIDTDSVAAMSYPYYDSNGDLLGHVRICDWGAFGFVPVREIP